MIKGVVFNPQIWVEDASELSEDVEPPVPALKSIRGTAGGGPAAVGAATRSVPAVRSVPAARSTTTSGLEWPALLATMAAELSKDGVDPSCFPKSVIRIHAAFNASNTSIDDLLRLIRAEPKLEELLVVLANAALFGAGAKRVTEVRGAVSQLGRPIIRAAAVSFAIQRMKEELRLRSIAAPLTELWRTSWAVACISQVIARRTKIKSEEAFCTGLLHGIGYLYIMARSVGKSTALGADLLGDELIGRTHPSVGKASLGKWGAGKDMANAVNDQHLHNRNVRSRDQADLTDILIVSIALAAELKEAEPRGVLSNGISSFQTLEMTAEDCAKTLKHAEYQLGSLHRLLHC